MKGFKGNICSWMKHWVRIFAGIILVGMMFGGIILWRPLPQDNLDREARVDDKTEYYTCEETEEDYIYAVNIWDKNGNLLHNGEYYDPYIKNIYEHIIFLVIGKGDYRLCTFFNVETGEISEAFDTVSAWNEEKVVYAIWEKDTGLYKIIVQDIFDKEKYYREILRDYSKTAIPHFIITDAEFISGSQLKLEYLVGENQEVVQEVIDL